MKTYSTHTHTQNNYCFQLNVTNTPIKMKTVNNKETTLIHRHIHKFRLLF